MTAALEIRGLQAGYGRTPVLHGLDLVVPAGVTAILGPSGCGKTTLLRTVAGFVTATAGTVAVGGTEVVRGRHSMPARLRGLGYVPQDGALFPHLDVAANISFGLTNGQRSTSGDRVAEMLDLVELPAAMGQRFPHELSGGQQQRVALARALAPRPTLVLLDEPFSSLDASLREDTGRAVVRALRAAGAAALLVTHDQGEALSLADQVAVMMEGSFLQVAAPAAVYLNPADPRVASFLGHASLVDGQATGAEATCALGTVPLRTATGPGPVRLAVRAEQIQIRPADAEGTSAEVVDISFYGHDATVRVRLDSGEELSARTPATTVPAPGERVRVGVVGDVVAFG